MIRRILAKMRRLPAGEDCGDMGRGLLHRSADFREGRSETAFLAKAEACLDRELN